MTDEELREAAVENFKLENPHLTEEKYFQEPEKSMTIRAFERGARYQAARGCPHPGCCCVCGHEGRCPEDGPTAGMTEAICD